MNRFVFSTILCIQKFQLITDIYDRIRKRFILLKSYWTSAQLKKCEDIVIFGSLGAVRGLDCIEIGANTRFGDDLFLTAWKTYRNQFFAPKIKIGRNCNFGAYNHITAVNSITIGDYCLTGKWVTISDNNHGTTDLEDLRIEPINRDVVSKGSVVIARNVWIGDKATILGGVTIGECAVIAANSVVVKDVPAYCVVAGNPAKIIKENKIWQPQES